MDTCQHFLACLRPLDPLVYSDGPDVWICHRDGFSNPSAGPARILPVVTPDALRLVEELFQLERVGQVEAQAGLEHAAVDPAAVAALYARYDSELVEG
jgi:hypothetical protein